jgi:hypothetical protein
MGEHEAPEESFGEKLRHLRDQNAKHAVADGHLKGWSAADFGEDDYSDDDYAAQFEVVSDGPVQN